MICWKKKIPCIIPFSPSINDKSPITNYDKYNDKISYYLTHKNPWNSQTSIDKNTHIKKFQKTNITKNEIIIKNKIKNSNEAKNILIDKYANEMMQLVSKKYEKEIKLKRSKKQ